MYRLIIHEHPQTPTSMHTHQALLFCHDRVATGDLYVPDKKFHRATQDPVDLIMSPSVCNFHPSDHPVNTSIPLSRDVPTTRKENATIIFLERSNRPLVRRWRGWGREDEEDEGNEGGEEGREEGKGVKKR